MYGGTPYCSVRSTELHVVSRYGVCSRSTTRGTKKRNVHRAQEHFQKASAISRLFLDSSFADIAEDLESLSEHV